MNKKKIEIFIVTMLIATSFSMTPVADWDPEADDWAWRVAVWSIRHMQDPEGFFHYQIHKRYRIRIPYIRWAQAWMQLALTDLLNGASYANMG